MNNTSCPANHPLCSTLIFLVGCMLGTYFGRDESIQHDLLVIVLATLVFHFAQVTQLRLSFKKSK